MGALVWKVSIGGQVYDADFETLKQWIAQGSVGPTDQVYKEGLGWSEAQRVPVLRDLFAPPGPAFGQSAGGTQGYGAPNPNPYQPPTYPQSPPNTYGNPYGQYGGGSTYGAPAPEYAANAPAYGQVGYGAMAYSYSNQLPPQASLVQRFFGTILDGIGSSVFCLPGFLFFFATARPTGDPENPIGSGAVTGLYLFVFLGAVGYLALCAWMMSRNGSTPGKKIVGTVVLDEHGQYLSFWKAVGREVLKNILGQACGLLLLWLLFDQNRQQLYDKAIAANVYEA
jgi:uncharacterized RDD family membrane protein YckC